MTRNFWFVLGAVILLAFVFRHSILSIVYSAFVKIAIQDAEINQIRTSDLGSKDLVLLDCREPEEYELSHLPDALFLGYKNPDTALLNSLDKDQTTVVYCTVGARSQKTAKMLVNKGFKKVFNLQGGIFQCSYDDITLVDENGPTDRVHSYSKRWGLLLSKGTKVY